MENKKTLRDVLNEVTQEEFFNKVREIVGDEKYNSNDPKDQQKVDMVITALKKHYGCHEKKLMGPNAIGNFAPNFHADDFECTDTEPNVDDIKKLSGII